MKLHLGLIWVNQLNAFITSCLNINEVLRILNEKITIFNEPKKVQKPYLCY